jgi:hypothetical protein
MDFEKVYSAAAADAVYLLDDGCAKVYASASDTAAGTEVFGAIVKELGRRNIEAKIVRTGSMGYYDLEPLLVVAKPGLPSIAYSNATPDTAPDLVAGYLLGGTENCFLSESALPFFDVQKRLVLAECGFIDPGNINHSIVRGKGYSGLQSLRHRPGRADRAAAAGERPPRRPRRDTDRRLCLRRVTLFHLHRRRGPGRRRRQPGH